MPKAAQKSKKPKKESEQKKNKALDKALEESFPGSDPVSLTQPAPTQPDQESSEQPASADKDEKQPA